MKLKLKKIAVGINQVDHQLVRLLAKRIRLSRRVAEAKKRAGMPIYRSGVERARLRQITRWASEEGVNPAFAQALLYSVIGESCKEQIIYLQRG